MPYVIISNVLYNRSKLNTATEQCGLDEFVLRLRQIAGTCECGTLKDFRDRLVIGTSDQACHERLLREMRVPDLDKCIDLLRTREISHTNRQAIAGSSSVEHIENMAATRRVNPQATNRKPANHTAIARVCLFKALNVYDVAEIDTGRKNVQQERKCATSVERKNTLQKFVEGKL